MPIYRRLPGSNSRESELAATKYLKEKADQLHQAGVGRTSVVTLHGNPAEQIIELSHRTENNLVVMSSHGHSNIGDWAFGSVIERVVRHCDDPVLVVRATEYKGIATSRRVRISTTGGVGWLGRGGTDAA